MSSHTVPLTTRMKRLPIWAQIAIEDLIAERDALTALLEREHPHPDRGEPPKPGELSLHHADGEDTAIRGWDAVRYHGRYDSDELVITPADADGSYSTAGVIVRSRRGRIAVMPLAADIVSLRGYVLARGADDE